MGCFASKDSSKGKPQAGFSPRDTQGPPPSSVPAKSPPPVNKKPPPPRLELPRSSAPKKPPTSFKSPHVCITTVYEAKDIIMLEMTPRGTIKNSVHFSCPICFNYFNVVLSSQCCKNYLCHRCAKDLLERDGKGGEGVACPTCQQEPLVLEDVDLQASVKVYTDTFAITVKREREELREEEDDGLEVKDSPLRIDDPENRL